MRLTGSGPNHELNACINAYQGEAAADLYVRAFHRGGDAIVEAVCSMQPDAYVDVLVYPAVYLYRHHLELLLKSLIEEASMVLEEPHAPRFGHKLAELWNEAKSLIERALPDADWNQNEHVTRLVNELDAIDPNGESFRYSESKRGTPNLRHEEHLNLLQCAETVGALSEYLGEVLDGLGSRNPRRIYD